jgi:hypothetical protein
MSGPEVWTQVVIHYLPTLRDLPSLAIRCKLHERHQAFNVTSADDCSPLSSSLGGYLRILTSSLRLRISRKIQLMRIRFLLGDGAKNMVIFLPFPTLFGDIHAGCLFLFSCVLLRNRDPFHLPHLPTTLRNSTSVLTVLYINEIKSSTD